MGRFPDPLLPAALLLAGGIAAARMAALGDTETAAAAAALGLLAVVARLLGTARMALAAVLTATFFAGAWLGAHSRPGPRPRLETGGDEVVILAGCVVEPSALSEGRERFVLELEPGARVRVTVYAREGQELPRLRYGQRVELDARVRPVRNFGNPGAFDIETYLARQQIYWTASANAALVRVQKGECGQAFQARVFAARTAVLERIERLYTGRPKDAAILSALLVGQNDGLERTWIDTFRRTGTYHAIVISGLHVTVLAGVFLFLMRLWACPETLALALTAGGAWVYALVCGGSAPVVRAAAGCTLYLAGRWFFRRTRLLNLLAAVALGFLVFDPEQALDASFLLSFLSVLVLGALAVPLLERTSAPYAHGLRHLADPALDLHLEPRIAQFRVELRLLAETLHCVARLPERAGLLAMRALLGAAFFVYELAIVSAVMQVGLALPMVVYFHRLSLTGVTANLVVVPLTSVAVPVGFAAVATGWHWLGAVAAGLVEAASAVAAWHAGWEPGWRIPDPPLWLAVLFVGALALVALARRWWTLVPAAVLLGALIWHPFAPKVEPGILELTAIDVGQGESLLLVAPEGRLLLVDTGGIPSQGGLRAPRMDIGEDVVSPYLWARSIRRLGAVLITHGHEDHAGGLQAVAENFRPGELWLAQGSALNAGTTHRRALTEGDRFLWGGARFEVLHAAASNPPQNDDSVVLRVSYGRHSFLLTGDIERPVEAALLERQAIYRTQALKVAHHGSRTSTGAPFVELARPAVALVSAGAGNPFRNPHPSVVARLKEANTVVLRTDELGAVTARTDGRLLGFDAWAWRNRTYPSGDMMQRLRSEGAAGRR